ncbi:MAG: hypothetical protein KJ721_00255 [Nanoarchaeota archaeon]|nr:hypothetical protein [Nanoarchaeota archaeon]
MKNKFELDFQFYRFWTFSLLAIIIAGIFTWYSLKDNGSVYSLHVCIFNVFMFILYLICNYMFLKNYIELKKILPDR